MVAPDIPWIPSSCPPSSHTIPIQSLPSFIPFPSSPPSLCSPTPCQNSVSSMSRARRQIGVHVPDRTSFSASDKDLRFSKRLAVSDFSILPPITASPICTPTSSLSSAITLPRDTSEHDSLSSTEEYVTPVTSPRLTVHDLFSLPTWISTPPTPPSRYHVKRSATCIARRPTSPISPSASFPSSMSPHVQKSSPHGSDLRHSPSSALHRPRATSEPLLRSPRRLDPLPSNLANDSSAVPSPLTGIPRENDLVAHSQTYPSTRRRTSFHFHIPIPDSDGQTGTQEDSSPDRSWSDHSSMDLALTATNRDKVKRHYALKELLATEEGYLNDLKALVTIYLRNLPTLAYRTTSFRGSASFSTGPWTNTYSQLQAVALSSTTTLSESHGGSQSSVVGPGSSRSLSRYLFTDREIEVLTRNAEEILQLHELFVGELKSLMAPFGFMMDGIEGDDLKRTERIDEAIRAVSTKFATEASRFNAYQSFCAGHPEAVHLVKKAIQHHPLEWEAFERHCSVMVSEKLAGEVSKSVDGHQLEPCEAPDPSGQTSRTEDRRRALSLTSLDGAVRSLRPRASILLSKDTSSSHSTPVDSRKPRNRIAFMDYLIKPVQRICKYPLLLDQLGPSKVLRSLKPLSEYRSDVDVVVESAAQAMRHVASSVDEAQHRQNVAVQTSLILSRIYVPNQTSLQTAVPRTLSMNFVSSLGTCLLAGSLDVMHYHPLKPLGGASTINAKYFGAFLYLGGYLILAKVHKGKKYEPRHWFSLSEFNIFDVNEEDAMLSCSFRLSCGEQHFEFAAACQREKDAWLNAIAESLTHSSGWIDEPTSSFKLDAKGELIMPRESESTSGSPQSLPTIQSVPELASSANSDTELSEPSFQPGIKPRSTQRYETYHRQDCSSSASTSRRSSTTSVKAIFGPASSDSETIIIRRSSPTARIQVDQGLLDVISHSCLTARSYASSREEELFQAPKLVHSGFTRSNSGMSVAGMAKNKLTKHESVRVPRRKGPGSAEGTCPINNSHPKKGSLVSRRSLRKLRITPISLIEGDRTSNDSHNHSTLSCSRSSSKTTSTLESGPTGSLGHSSQLVTLPAGKSPKSSLSLVRNMKGLFQFRSSIISEGTQAVVALEHHSLPPNLLKRFTRGPLHSQLFRSSSEELGDPDAIKINESHTAEDAMLGSDSLLVHSPKEMSVDDFKIDICI